MEEQFIKDLKYALDIENRDLNLSDKFRDYEEWDSLGQLNLIAMLDESYKVAIETEDLNKLITVEDLIKEVSNRSNGN